MPNFTFLKCALYSIQTTDSHQEVLEETHQENLELRQENLGLREQLSNSSSQISEISAKYNLLETKLTELSSRLHRRDNRFNRLREAYNRRKEELCFLQVNGRSQDQERIQTLNRSVEQLNHDYNYVLDQLHTENLLK
jgi:predicted nuclease with TOPRIM domain